VPAAHGCSIARLDLSVDEHSLSIYRVNNFTQRSIAMRFQPGQSGNPAGRPPGSRNKHTLEAEVMLAERAEATVTKILDRADRGEPAAMRLCMDRIAPTGANRPIAIELPPVEAPDDVVAATRVVMGALTAGEISARETINLLTVIERLARLAERVQQMRERHAVWQPRSAAAGTPGLYSPVNSSAAGKEAQGEALYSPVISGAETDAETSSPAGAGNGPVPKEGSTGAAASEIEQDGLYFPVNSDAKPAAGKAPPGSILRGRRRALMASVSPRALLIGEQPIDPRSYVTDQTWLASMRNESPGTTKRSAA
jgi:hypothetical protein